ncbi:AmmeMemoRadiSam system protein B [Candidatus Berkelbacteria bacterium CG10_big_fil_rev_8_21_14_0_10_43_13]|uniref:AmmeMemoRadiSam system protein B n=1 Tax=Candidatus Berkelbacteria bacterium CG10_big_fil_rev_8_21_14_0_10_43_13 TaxID=1974514 RepID=A0A2H0W716_9BACT|nr:MAG: AmmeMemoRadiSam system protein B [Candidatus Berkelbacteria bacterium CG10_big_fil_rev_8_21_14_0_10_43_13]
MLVFAGIVPHPPIIVPEVGKEDTKKTVTTISAYQKLAGELAAAEPDTIIIISPHMIHYPHLFTVCGMSELFGSFAAFEAPEINWRGHNNLELAGEIVDKAESEGLPTILYNNGDGQYEVDHGVLVPIHFLMPALDYPAKILPLSYSYASQSEHCSFGQIISEVIERHDDERVAVIASGDLSHRLIGSASAEGKAFDNEILSLIKKGDEYSIMNMSDEMLEKVGECGYRSILILLGVLSGLDYKPEVYSYEGPFGVGYAVVNMNVNDTN